MTPPVRVLYVDDDQGLCRLVGRHLARDGFAVEVACDGEAGLALARAQEFDVIALDHFMPGRDGLDVLADLVGLPAAPPIIFVTAAEEPRIAVAALKAGAFDYVVKDVQGTFMEFLSTSIRQSQHQVRLRRERETALQELQESRDRLEKLAAQQALLLREVNHRIANSLQLISSLIELQARKIADPDAREALKRAAERVEAVMLVHRRLYTSNDVEFVAMDQYLEGLIDELRRAGAVEERSGQITLLAEPIRVETDKAVSIGLIVNELVTNALKYAYPGGDGDIRVGFRRHADTVQLVVEDDGVGYESGAAPKGSGLGTMIVNAMARTVQATVAVDPKYEGTRVVVSLAM
ncbi:sensor histidine kinase [Acidisphaera sp. L21]|uniref:sensor histidine kinase n=1 Tax=Acidisphaera sp. L21 TaxID=1641851 RepID=UPI00131BE854|nr:response regulator [Acidisphaera sp. L21]